MTGLDPPAAAAVERQLALLAPASRRLAAASAHPPHLADGDWRGVASHAYRRREQELASLLGSADHALSAAVTALRRLGAGGG